MKRARPDPFKGPAHKIFNPDKAGGAGVWNGHGSTKTLPNSTLFVMNIAPPVTLQQVKDLFQLEPGFINFRSVRMLAFVDFDTIKYANNAMRKYQSFMFPAWEGRTEMQGLLIDYDKDPKAKRNQQFEKQRSVEIKAQESKELRRVYCKTCGAQTLLLKLPEPKTFDGLPKRKTDGSIVINCLKYVVSSSLSKGDVKKIKREKGVEKQYRMLCKGCEVQLGYSAQPFDITCRLMYLFAEAVVESKTGPPPIQGQCEAQGAEGAEDLSLEMEQARHALREREKAHEKEEERQKQKDQERQQDRHDRRQKEDDEKRRKEEQLQKAKEEFWKARQSDDITGKMKDPFVTVFRSHGPSN